MSGLVIGRARPGWSGEGREPFKLLICRGEHNPVGVAAAQGDRGCWCELIGLATVRRGRQILDQRPRTSAVIQPETAEAIGRPAANRGTLILYPIGDSVGKCIRGPSVDGETGGDIGAIVARCAVGCWG